MEIVGQVGYARRNPLTKQRLNHLSCFHEIDTIPPEIQETIY